MSFREQMQGELMGTMKDLRSGADVIELHEIHLARQSSLQVPVGHIAVPGGIKLCSPGTFWVANYLIINNGSCQVNFTKPNRATIRYTNSQWPRGDATETPVGRVTVPKTGQKTPLPREDATEAPVGRVAVPKTGQKSALQRDNLYPMVPPVHEARAGGPARYEFRNSGTK